jgi:hypothetical protein
MTAPGTGRDRDPAMNSHSAGHDRLRTDLRDLAEAYRPDRAAIATRAAAGRAAAARRDRMRPIAAATAVLGVVAAIVVGVNVRDDSDARPVVAVAPRGATSAPVSPADGEPAVIEPADGEPAATQPADTEPSATKPAKPAFMSCTGSVDKNSAPTWTQDTVTVSTSKRTADVAVTISVPRAAGTRASGKFSTVPNSDLTMTVEETADALLYHFRLAEGAHLPPGNWVFAAQFEHRAGRARQHDSYVVSARAASGAGSWNGDFSGI